MLIEGDGAEIDDKHWRARMAPSRRPLCHSAVDEQTVEWPEQCH
jgi:hypothetical protein